MVLAGRERFEQVLRKHGVSASRELVDELLFVTRDRQAWWDTDRCAEYLGVEPQSVRGWLSKRGIRRVMMVSADEVRREKRLMPGQGAPGRPKRRRSVRAD